MIPINFASRNYRLIRRIQTAITGLAVLLLIAAALILRAGISLRADIAALDKKVKEMEAAEEQVRPLLAERDGVVKDLKAMSGLIESRRFSWTQLLTNIEKIFPTGVALARVQYNRANRSLALDGAAQSPESLRNLMIGLEGNSAFREPYLKHQSMDKGSISFNVVAFYREP
jgi:Tfp pilus assembly protein PilN